MINVHIEVFDGPLDLLYRLIEKNEIDIYNIPISELADQYISHMNAMAETDMDTMSSFIVLAATLLEIKSRMLLPGEKKEDEEDPRGELVQKLLEYRQFKELAEQLSCKREGVGQLFFKDNELELYERSESREQIVSELLSPLSLEQLRFALIELLARKESNVDKVRSGYGSVYRDRFTIADRTEHILALLREKNHLHFDELFSDNAGRQEIVVTFLALLDLIKTREVSVKQDANFGKILIEKSVT